MHNGSLEVSLLVLPKNKTSKEMMGSNGFFRKNNLEKFTQQIPKDEKESLI